MDSQLNGTKRPSSKEESFERKKIKNDNPRRSEGNPANVA